MSDILETYKKLTPASAAAEQRAEKSIIGGNSRGTAFWEPHPVTLESGAGAKLIDLDGNEYIDLVNNFTSLVHGHCYEPIQDAVSHQLAKGTCWVGNNRWQMELAELLIERVASLESVRFTNSGSEASALAMTIARTVTGRHKILMARYGYHGISLEFEVGSVPVIFKDTGATTYLGTYNDAASFEAILAEHGSEIAAVFLEPVMGAGGLFSATPEFLNRVQAAAKAAGALFVLDEVITFRLATGAAQSVLDIEPDLTMFGKVIGGGFPVGAVGGNLDYMKIFDPLAPKALHSGTFCGNPVTMAAGVVSVRELTGERIEQMDRFGARLADALKASAAKTGLPLFINRAGSLLNLYFQAKAPEAITLDREDARPLGLFHLAALNRGLMPAARGMVALSTVMDENMIDDIARRAEEAMIDVAAELE